MNSKNTSPDFVELDHGTGARLSRELIEFIASTLGDVHLGSMEDSAVLSISAPQILGEEAALHPAGVPIISLSASAQELSSMPRDPYYRIAMTTDSFVVDPYLFLNGDIGKIAVCGTVNDLAVMGAEPLYLTLALIIEAGFPFSHLHRILTSIRDTATDAGIKIIAGDTKVVGKGEADGIFLNTTGLGIFKSLPLRMADVEPGDQVIVTSFLGNHSIHLLSIREGLGFETRVLSDCAPLNGLMSSLLSKDVRRSIHSARDVTRGGLAGVMHEFAQRIGSNIRIYRDRLPIQQETIMATDMLGIDPIHLANEGCLCLFVSGSDAASILHQIKSHPLGVNARIVGEVTQNPGGAVELVDSRGQVEVLEELVGAELPRLC